MSLIDAWDIDTSFSLPNDEPDLGHLTGASMAGSRAQRFSFEDSALDMESTDTNVLTVTEEKPVFSMDSSLWRRQRPRLRDLGLHNAEITAAAAENGVVVYSTSQGRLVVWNTNSDSVQEIKHKSSDAGGIIRLSLDPSGVHLLLFYRNAETAYCNIAAGKIKSVSQLKGIRVTSVTWDRELDQDGSVHEALLGTTEGTIWRFHLDGKERSAKAVYDLGEKMKIIGLELERFPRTRDGQRLYVMAATPTRYFQFIGGPTLEDLFNSYEMNAPFVDVPADSQKASLHAFRKHRQARLLNFAWLSGAGVYSGRFHFADQITGEGTVGHDDLCPYPATDGEEPIQVCTTEFHFILLYRSRMIVLNQLSQEVVFENSFVEEAERTHGVTVLHDAGKGVFWLVLNTGIREIVVKDEERDVWWLYLKKHDFNGALQHCNTLQQRNRVLSHQAAYLFSQRQYDQAAQVYAKTDLPFEEVTLKFIHYGEQEALKTFLIHKMDNISNSDKTQLTLIATWLLEMHLNTLSQIAIVDQRGEDFDQHPDVIAVKNFLADVKDYLDRKTAYHMISTHGHMKLWLFYADLLQDHERVITYHVQQQQYEDALRNLKQAGDPELYYKYSPVLMAHCPTRTVDAWIDAATLVDPRKLITAMLPLDLRTENEASVEGMEDRQFELMDQAIRYLEHVVNNNGCEDPAVHNFLITMYALRDKEDDIIRCLETNEDLGKTETNDVDLDDDVLGLGDLKLDDDDFGEISEVAKKCSQPIDLKYALRICNRRGKKKACMVIYSHLGLYEEAVALALAEHDLETARAFVNKAKDMETKRSLWLQIVRYVIGLEDGVNKVIQLVSETKMITIEDVLPYFPDSVHIEDFKDHISDALERYKSNIENLNKKMEQATKGAERIRADLKQLRNRSNYVSGSQRCEMTGERVLDRPFLVFPCGHIALETALISFLRENFVDNKRIRLDDLIRKIKHTPRMSTPHSRDTESISAKRPSWSDLSSMPSVHSMTIQECKAELESLLTEECPACGSFRVESIDKPFISPSDASEERAWRLY